MTATNADGRWFVNYRPNPRAKLKLFCFPYAGGSSAIFSRWPKALAPDVDLWAAEYPGHGVRRAEPPLAQIERLADEFLSHLMPHLKAPFAVFGHSLGALVAFEILRRLRAGAGDAGRTPAGFFAAGCRAPAVQAERRAAELVSNPDFAAELRAFSKMAADMPAHDELVTIATPALRADFEAWKTYDYAGEAALRCPVFAYGGLADPAVTRDDLDAWAGETSAAFGVRMFPGDHFFIHGAEPMLLRVLSMDLRQAAAAKKLA